MNTNNEAESEQANNSKGKESVSDGNKATEKDSLAALVSQEQSYARQRLREELGREPAQEEVDRWLSEQTEGY